MFRFALEKPFIVTVGILIVCIYGIIAFFRVPVQMIPDLDPRVISINTWWSGASPQDVEKEILIEQEEYLRSIPGVERMISTASTSSATIELEFPHGTDINEALIKVNNALSQVSGYPENVDEPSITSSSFSSNSFMYFALRSVPGNPHNHNILTMRDFLEDNVQTFIERVPGVESTRIRGGEEQQIKIYVDPIKLAERNLNLIDVRNAIRSRNRDVSGGDLDNGKRRYLLRTRGRFESIESINNLVLQRQGDAIIRLKDIGYVEESLFEIRTLSYLNSEPIINLAVKRQIGSNVIQIMDDVMVEVERINREFLNPQGLQIDLISEDVRYVKASVKVVSQNLLIGACLAVFILFLFLRSTSATLVGAIGIPICTVTAFLGLLITGRTMNVISMAGIAFAIGMTLDNSIVVLENIYKHMTQGKSRFQAALEGVREVWPAILASTLTTVFVFLPIVLIQEEAGQLYSDISIAISASIFMSMIVAITVVPMACSRFLTPNQTPPAQFGLYRMGQVIGKRVISFVNWLLHGLIRRITLIVLVLFAAFWILQNLTPQAEYLPEGEEKKIFAFVFAPPGYNLQEMSNMADKGNAHFTQFLIDKNNPFDKHKQKYPVDYVVSFLSAQSILFIIETSEQEYLDLMTEDATQFLNQFPGVISFVSRGSIFAGNVGGTRSINVDISGRHLDTLFDAGFKAFIKSREVFDNPRVRPQPSSLSLGQPMIEIYPDWERAAELGITADELGYTIWAYSDGAFVDEYYKGDKKIDMFLYSIAGNIESPEDLNHLMLYSRPGGVVPLSEIAEVKSTVNTETIRRVDNRRTITLSIIPPKDIPLEQGVAIVKRDLIQAMLESGEVTDDIAMNISGASDRLDSTRKALQGNFIIALIISFLIMAAIFSHWGFPLLILTSVPIGISGGIVGLWLMNVIGAELDKFGMQTIFQPFDMITMLGFLVLIGTVVNNPILLVERTLVNLRQHSMDTIAAIVEATRSRIRPIMMSMITTIFGLSPLVFNPGEGTELYRGLGAIVLFGLLFSTVITLTFMPCLLSLVLQLQVAFKSRFPRPSTADSANEKI